MGLGLGSGVLVACVLQKQAHRRTGQTKDKPLKPTLKSKLLKTNNKTSSFSLAAESKEMASVITEV